MLSMGGSIAVMSTPRLTIQLGHGISTLHLNTLSPRSAQNLVLAQLVLLVLVQLVLHPPGSAMPRERGKPRRGPTWYSHAARKRCLHNLERALSIARTQRIVWPHTPPMAFVEEEFLEEPIQVPPESLLYTVSDDYLRPNTSVVVTGTEAAMDGATCIVQEEFSEEFLHTVPDTHIHPNTSGDVTGEMTTDHGGSHLHYSGGVPHHWRLHR
jgi:hypothetical protein